MFAGLLRREGGPAPIADVQAMLRALPGRPTGEAAWAQSCVALGPLAGVDAPRQLAITGDLLLTNAAALAAQLRLPRHPRPSDAALVLAAYRRWGAQMPERLDGDFAFALWDGRRRILLCARDALGIKPLYYHVGSRIVAFASDAAAVRSLPDVPRRLDARALATYLAASFDDRVATGYRDVSRLAPGQTLVVDGARTTLRTYWSPDPRAELRLRGDAEYEEAFRHAITAAVAARMGAGRVGVSLSGGLDSSAIACVAGRLEPASLRAYTAVYDDDPEGDERAFVAAVVAQCGATARQCRPSASSPLADWPGASWMGAMPACDPQVALSRVTLAAAAEDAVPILLHGFGGDSVVSHGLAYLAELAAAGRLIRAARETDAFSRRHGRGRRAVARTYVVAPYVPDGAMRVWTSVKRRPVVRATDVLRPEVVSRLGLGRRAGAQPARNARLDHAADVGAGIQSHVLEVSYRVDAVAGVERRYPFFDRRLVELCLSLPGDQKLRQGWTRSIMRRALADVLPEAVVQRPGKASLGPAFVRALRSTDRAVLEAVVADPGALAQWIDPAALGGLWQRCRAGGSERDWFTLWRVAVAARWMAHHGFDDARQL